MSTPSRRVYPVPGSFQLALLAAGPVGVRVARDGVATESALRVLAACEDPELALWACGVCNGLDAPPEVEGLYPAPGPHYGLLDGESDDPEVIVALFRAEGEDLVRWTGTGWDLVPDQFDPVGAAYVEIPDDQLPWYADPFRSGTAGIALRPTSPRGFLPRPRVGVPVVSAAESTDPVFAVVDDMDTTAVLDLFRVGPGPEALVREHGEWVPDPDLLSRLRGVDPPRVVQVKDTDADGVVGQVDAHDAAKGRPKPAPAPAEQGEEPVTAGVNPPATTRMPGDLKDYWAHGKGAVKIRWGTGGDFKRCQRQLRRYLRPGQVDGACANLHKLAAGVWPGRGKRHGVTAAAGGDKSGAVIVAVPSRDDPTWAVSSEPKPHMTLVWLGDLTDEDQLDAIRAKVAGVAAHCNPAGLRVTGREELGDDHADVLTLDPGSLAGTRDELLADPVIRAAYDAAEQYPSWTPHLTVGYPERPAAGEPPGAVQFDRLAVWDGDYEGQEYEMGVQDYDEFDPIGGSPVRLQLVASGGPVRPPRSWFEDPGLDGPTPLTIDADGRVRGHIAAWGVRHIGMPGNVTPPRSRSNYQFFRTGVVETDGGDVPVGQLTLAGGHAPISADAGAAVAHYDNTASSVADLAAGEDRYGIWVAGAVRPGVTDEQVRALRASAPSGDWRPINGGLELVAVCQVNVPGFPVARARVASGQVLALVAAGAHDMALRRYNQTATLEGRVQVLEGAAKTALRRRVAREH